MFFVLSSFTVGCWEQTKDDDIFSTDEPIDESCQGAIVFPDANLEAAVREAINLPQGEIFYEDVRRLDEFIIHNIDVSDLKGIQCLNNLSLLILRYSSIEDISLLSFLNKLTYLSLEDNLIVDISPLSCLSNLENLILYSNSITDISPLGSLTNLTELYLSFNNISDISSLANLTNLRIFYVNYNYVADISPLSELYNLYSIGFEYNSIQDITPLISNPGIGKGDEINLKDNPLNCEDPTTQENITILNSRDLSIFIHDCD